MKKVLGLAIFLGILYAVEMAFAPGARSAGNHYSLGERIGLYGILSLGAGILIIVGGLDLSLGSVVGLCATLLAMMMMEWGWNPLTAMMAVVLVGAVIGLGNGLIITKLHMQPFIVTLCGLFLFRGAARWISGERVQGLRSEFPELKNWLAGDLFGLPVVLLVLLLLAAVATVFLHGSVLGRYLFAIGSNERAARYSGIPTDRFKIMAYMLCSALGGFFSIFFLMKYNSAQPSGTGEFFELYAIAGAVLGGCSLRGGEGTVCGILIGTCIIWLPPNMATFFGIQDSWTPIFIGGALLLGAILDETLRTRSAARDGN
jgi:ribose transport system permease protein